MDNPETSPTLAEQDTGRGQTTNKPKTPRKLIKIWAVRTPPKNHRCTKVYAKGTEFLLLIRHPRHYSYI